MQTLKFSVHTSLISSLRRVAPVALIVVLALLESCAPSVRYSVLGRSYAPPSSTRSTATTNWHAPSAISTAEQSNQTTGTDLMEGVASFYGDEFQGRLTSNGEVFDQSLLTAAHRTLAFGTVLKVTNMKNGRSVIVRVNDRGPFAAGRILDLSRAAAEKLDMLRDGVARVSIAILN